MGSLGLHQASDIVVQVDMEAVESKRGLRAEMCSCPILPLPTTNILALLVIPRLKYGVRGL
jgi:hypothetical protein